MADRRNTATVKIKTEFPPKWKLIVIQELLKYDDVTFPIEKHLMLSADICIYFYNHKNIQLQLSYRISDSN